MPAIGGGSVCSRARTTSVCPPSDTIDPLQRPSVISSSNLSSSTRGVSDETTTTTRAEKSGGDEGTNRNYPSLNMRFTESTIQIRQARVETGNGRDFCNPLYL